MISVVMASYNSSKYIRLQIDSIINNLDKGDELIICDDLSEDGTRDILLEYASKHSQIILSFNKDNLGVNKNFERALAMARGDYIFISDDDDWWDDTKIPRMLSFIKKKKIIMVVHDCSICNENLEIIEDSYFKIRSTKTGLIHTIIRPGYRGATMCFKKELLKYILPFPSKMSMFYDEWISLMAEKHGEVYLVREVLSFWRRLNTSVSTVCLGTQRNKNNYIKKMWARIIHRLKKIILVLYR